jgi:hypothetical protein
MSMPAAMGRNVRAIAIGAAIWLALAGAVAVGSWQHARGPENERPQARETVAGFTTYAVPSAGFTIAVPETWRTFTADEVFEDRAELEEFARQNPDLGPFAEVLGDRRSPMKLIAADPNLSDGLATNMNVVVQNLPEGVSFEALVRNTETEIRSIGLTRDVESETVRLPAGSAQRLSYKARFVYGGTPHLASVLQYALVANGRGYVLTYTTLPELEGDYRDDFERSARSFAAK